MAWRSNKTKENALIAFNSCDELIVFDTETTGLSSVKNHIIQISAIKFRIVGECDLEKTDELNLYINPGYSIPPKITECNGITDAMVFDQPAEDECFATIYEFFKNAQIIAGQNIEFDIKMVKAMYERQGEEFEYSFKLDTLEMARDIIPKGETENYKLGTLAALYGVDTGLTFHNSMDDVTATTRLLVIFIKEYLTKSDSEEVNCEKKQASIFSLKYWEGYKGFSRIYINTNIGGFFYDIRTKTWDKKKDNPNELDEVDMESLRNDAFEFAGASNEAEFARYRG